MPAYHLTGWYDSLLNGTLANFSGLRANAGTERARRNQRLIVGAVDARAARTRHDRTIGDVRLRPGRRLRFGSAGRPLVPHWMPPAATAEPGCGMADANAHCGACAARARLGRRARAAVRDGRRTLARRAGVAADARHRHAVLPAQQRRGANGRAGGGRARAGGAAGRRRAPDAYNYDPAKPVPTGSFGAYSRTPVDRREVQ